MKTYLYILYSLGFLLLCQPIMAQKKQNSKKNNVEVSTVVQPTWESINQRGYPEWFSDAKLGIFIHWGPYSVPAYASKEGYAEWFYRGLMTHQLDRCQMMKYLADTTLPIFEQYAQIAYQWRAELWNPDQWAQLFKDAGARYIVLVTKHHDGYCLWDNKSTYDERPLWNSVLSGPKRDIVGNLADAIRKQGIRFGAYYSLPEWTNKRHIWMEHSDDSIADYVENYMIPQFKDMVTRYRPEVLFTDGEWQNKWQDFHATELISWYYNTIGPDAIVNNRWGSGEQHGFRTPEYSAGITMTDRPWAECRGLGRSFGFNRNEPVDNYLSSDELIQHFVKLVSAGGGMTLNVSPMADGTIPINQQERLLDLGKWLSVNGEAIYNTRPWSRFNDTKAVSIQRLDSVIDFDWKRNSPDHVISYDNFTAIWQGTLIPTATDEYTFYLTADDSASLSITDVDNPNERSKFLISTKDTQTAKVNLMAGHRYLLYVNYTERDLEATLSLLWSSHKMAVTPIKPLEGWHATYSCQQPYVCYTKKNRDLYAIVLGWQGDIFIPFDHQPENLTVSILGIDKPIRWSYDKQRNAIQIYTDNLDYFDISKSRAAWTFKLEGILK